MRAVLKILASFLMKPNSLPEDMVEYNGKLYWISESANNMFMLGSRRGAHDDKGESQQRRQRVQDTQARSRNAVKSILNCLYVS